VVADRVAGSVVAGPWLRSYGCRSARGCRSCCRFGRCRFVVAGRAVAGQRVVAVGRVAGLVAGSVVAGSWLPVVWLPVWLPVLGEVYISRVMIVYKGGGMRRTQAVNE
jgi:hypothetical protein